MYLKLIYYMIFAKWSQARGSFISFFMFHLTSNMFVFSKILEFGHFTPEVWFTLWIHTHTSHVFSVSVSVITCESCTCIIICKQHGQTRKERKLAAPNIIFKFTRQSKGNSCTTHLFPCFALTKLWNHTTCQTNTAPK